MRRALLLVLFVSVFGCAQHHAVLKELDQTRVRPLSELKTVNDPRELNNWAGYLDEGESIPLKLSIESEWLGIRQDHVDLVCKKKIYFRLSVREDISKERLQRILDFNTESLAKMTDAERAQLFQDVMLYLSDDAVHWAPFNNAKALKEVFAIKGGQFSAGVGMNETEGAWAALTVKTLSRN